MRQKDFNQIIDRFLAGEDIDKITSEQFEKKEDQIFAKTLGAFFAEKQLERKKLKERFNQLDAKYQPKIVELFSRSSKQSPKGRMMSMMKAALDDISERNPVQSRKDASLSIVSDEIIKAFLSGNEEK